MLRSVSLHGGKPDLDGRNEGVDGVPMEVRTTAAADSARVARRDPRKHTIHGPGSRDVGCSEMRRVRMILIRARASVSDEDGMRARLAKRIGRLVQLGKASAIRVVRVTDIIQWRFRQDLHGSVHVQR
eukprot:793307-Pleurochrysis_carterae.AAC.1